MQCQQSKVSWARNVLITDPVTITFLASQIASSNYSHRVTNSGMQGDHVVQWTLDSASFLQVFCRLYRSIDIPRNVRRISDYLRGQEFLP
jgi:uncharacterized membrane protein